MKIRISTPVKGNYKEVMARFDQQLLEQLTPPGISAKLLRYDGSKPGDIVHIQLTILGILKQEWISEITEEGEDDQRIFFVDEGNGKQLPSFLSTWKHQHIVENDDPDSVIVDDIEYTTPFFLLDWLMYPMIFLQFIYRKPIYRRVFNE